MKNMMHTTMAPPPPPPPPPPTFIQSNTPLAHPCEPPHSSSPPIRIPKQAAVLVNRRQCSGHKTDTNELGIGTISSFTTTTVSLHPNQYSSTSLPYPQEHSHF